MKLGIVQGRLLEPVDNKIQEFPIENWKKELNILHHLELIGVEWIINKNYFEGNPIFDTDFDYFEKITSECLDNLITDKIHVSEYLEEVLDKVCSNEKIVSINIPLLEESSMESKSKRYNFINKVNEYAELYQNKEFLFEAELDLEGYLEIVNSKPNFFATYDTGNLTSYKVNHSEYILGLNDKIKCVHIKDRSIHGESVKLFEGDTDFDEIFSSLSQIKYKGLFILQLARGNSGSELETVKEQVSTIKKLYSKYF